VASKASGTRRQSARNLECTELRLHIVRRGCLLRIVRACKRQYLEIAVGHGAAKALFGKPHIERGVGAHNCRHHDRRVRGQHRRGLLNMMAEPGQQACDFANRRCDFGIDGIAVGRFVGKGDAHPAGVTSDLLRERPLRRRRDIKARWLGSVDCIEHRGAVAHADAEHMATGKPGPAFAAIRTERIARAGGFQSEHAGGRGGNTDRAAAIAGMRDRKNARGNGRTGAAGRTS
jgi:hypothetical protein